MPKFDEFQDFKRQKLALVNQKVSLDFDKISSPSIIVCPAEIEQINNLIHRLFALL
jgi:hypothetical protein